MNENYAENTLAELAYMVSMNEEYNRIYIETKAGELKVFLMFYYKQYHTIIFERYEVLIYCL